MFICGSGSFGHEDHDQAEHESSNSPCQTPKRSRRSASFCRILGRDGGSKNPYADRGLDKFYALLADLDDKKQKIYTQKGSEDISFVRFVYTNDSNSVKPIVVKVKERKQEKNGKDLAEQRSFKSNTQADTHAAEKTNPTAAPSGEDRVAGDESKGDDQKQKRRRCLIRCDGSFKLENLRHPHYYFPVAVVMILLFLAIYGRSFAILCTSIGWYLAPTVVGGSPSSLSSERKPKRKKEYVRKQSERKIARSAGPSSPKSVINGLNESRVPQQQRQQQQQQQQQHGRKRSW